MGAYNRTDYCGDLRMKDSGREVMICGWVQKQRNLGSLIFVDLRDRSGICQIVFDESTPKDVFESASTLKSEYVIAVKGVLRERGSKNLNIPTGEVEIEAKELKIYSSAETPPFAIEEDSQVNDALRLKYRYLDLRRPDMQKNIALRHRVAKIARDYFDDNGFLEIETPMLIKSSPEGARDYLVPSRVHPGKFYALPQSPQLYKQLLMMSGFDRYMQIVRCFRDEDLRADRQPEFTQIDIEMSFVGIDDVIGVNEGFIKRVFKEALGVDIETPLMRMPYKEAMERFGSDKPDIRFGFELKDITSIVKNCGFSVFSDPANTIGQSVRAINIDGYGDRFSRKDIDSLSEFAKTYGAKGLAWMKMSAEGEISSPIAKFLTPDEINFIKDKMDLKPNSLLLFAAGKDKIVFDILGALRIECAKRLQILKKDDYQLLWVTEFPLLEYSEEEGRYMAMHHPFTSPMDEDMDLLLTCPQNVRAKAYDIVLNGVELGGGSIRIHSTELQEKMFGVLGFTMEDAWQRFGYLMKAFKYGTPPHGGMAYGLDRLLMLLSGCETIKDVIAFPKVQNASELMSGAPSEVDLKQLEELRIKTVSAQ